MQRHQRHRAALFLHAVQIGHQRHVFQKVGHAALGVEALKVRHRAAQFLDVLQPRGVFVAGRGLVLARVAGFLQQRIEEFRRLLLIQSLGQVDHHFGKAAHRRGRTRGERHIVHIQRGAEQRKLVLAAVFQQRLHGAVANGTPGLVDDTAGGDVVVRVDQRAHVGDDVLDLLAVVELQPAVNAVGRAGAYERLFQHARLGVGAVKHRHLPRAVFLRLPPRHGGDVGGLVALVEGAVEGDLFALAGLGPQRLFLAAAVVGDDLVGGVEYVGGRAVVLFQFDHFGVGKILFKIEDVADVRPAPAVDGLVVVADHAEVALLAREQAHQFVLRGVGVLILVHQYVVEAVAVIGKHRRLAGQQFQRFEQQIVKVEGVVAAQALLVAGVDLA